MIVIIITNNFNIYDNYMQNGDSPLHEAAINGCEESMELLLRYGAVVNIKGAVSKYIIEAN